MKPNRDFQVDLDVYRGPLDLLLYLVRRHEVEPLDVPLAAVADQYLAYLETLQFLEIDAVGDFLEIASMLVEIKSRMALPRASEEVEEEVEEARADLVQRLLDYKRFKDAAVTLEERSRQWGQRVGRQAVDLPEREVDLSEQPIGDVELWDLVSAFGRIIREQQEHDPTNIVYDDTPIHVYMQQVHQRLARHGSLAFTEAFETSMHKSAMIGMFLAVLELSRHYGVSLEQPDPHGEIFLCPGERFEREFRLSSDDPLPTTTEEQELAPVASGTADADADSDFDPWGVSEEDEEE